jgi:hypothetical protein
VNRVESVMTRRARRFRLEDVHNVPTYKVFLSIERRSPQPHDPSVRVELDENNGDADRKMLLFLKDADRVPLLRALAEALGYRIARLARGSTAKRKR